MPSKFNIGDRVRCINDAYSDLVQNEVYEVLGVRSARDGQYLIRVMNDREWYESRFHIVEEVPQLEVISYQIYWKTSPDAIHIQIYASTDERQSEIYIASVRRICGNAVVLGKKKIKVKFPL